MFDIRGKKAMITGAGGGIGSVLAKGLVEAGAIVAMIDVSPNVIAIADGCEGTAIPIVGDLFDREKRKETFEKALQALNGTVDILINNVGIQRRGLICEFSDQDWDMVMELNLNVAFSFTKMVGPYMIGAKSGKIINLASMNSYLGGTNVPAYAASKGAIVQFTKAIANEWSKYGINANAIAPGFIETALTQDNITEYVITDASCENLAFKAMHHAVKKVVVGPSSLPVILSMLGEKAVEIGVTVSYPSGAYFPEAKVAEMEELKALYPRVDAFYVVPAEGRFIGGAEDAVAQEIKDLVEMAADKKVHVITEIASLKEKMASFVKMVRESGAQGIMISTGFTPYKASFPTEADVAQLLTMSSGLEIIGTNMSQKQGEALGLDFVLITDIAS